MYKQVVNICLKMWTDLGPRQCRAKLFSRWLYMFWTVYTGLQDLYFNYQQIDVFV